MALFTRHQPAAAQKQNEPYRGRGKLPVERFEQAAQRRAHQPGHDRRHLQNRAWTSAAHALAEVTPPARKKAAKALRVHTHHERTWGEQHPDTLAYPARRAHER